MTALDGSRAHQRTARFCGFGKPGQCFFLHFLQLAGQADARRGVHTIDEEDTVEVIDLVLRGAREQSCAVKNQFLAVEAGGANGHLFRTADLGVDVGDAQATFRGDLLAFGLAELGIKQDQRHGRVDVERLAIDKQLRGPLGGGDIDDGEHQRVADLLRGQANSVLGVHGLNHVGGEFTDLRRDAFDALALLAQHRMTVFGDFQNHALSIPAERGGVKVEGRSTE